MIRLTNKTKYALQAAFIAVIFILLNSSVQASEITPDNVVDYVNLARQAQGVDILVVNDKLMKVAQDKLNDMIANKYFAHTSPTGVNPWYWFQHEGYDYHFAGENLAINFKTAESEQAAWMGSPMHRKNILDSNFQEIGVAVGKQEADGQTSIIAVQEFGTTFAGIGTGEKNFSPLSKKALIEKDDQIVPQVLSARNTAAEGSGIAKWFGDNKLEIINRSSLIMLVIITFSIVLMAVSFLAIALDKMVFILEAKKQKKQVANLF